MSIISNTTVLVNFAEIGQIAVLPAIFATIFLPTEVYAELQDGVAEGYRFLEPLLAQVSPPVDQGWLQQTTLADAHELRLISTLPAGLHRGEAACVAIAAQRSWLLLTDDRAARAEARRRGLRLSGSIGCLVRAVEHNVATLTEANTWLAAMVANGYYAPVTDLAPLVSLGRAEPAVVSIAASRGCPRATRARTHRHQHLSRSALAAALVSRIPMHHRASWRSIVPVIMTLAWDGLFRRIRLCQGTPRVAWM